MSFKFHYNLHNIVFLLFSNEWTSKWCNMLCKTVTDSHWILSINILFCSLLELLGSYIPQQNKKGLLELISVYLGETKNVSLSHGDAHTLAELPYSNEETQESSTKAHPASLDNNGWVQYSGER
jgi:cadmium resistance protein CadD (predicted permease)